jgi:carboxymethylenebutenolidase
MSVTQLTIPTGPVPVHVRTPAGDPPWPAVIQVHDALGITSDSHRQAEWLASAGYLVATPDLFSWGGTLRCLFATFREIGSRREGRAFDAVEATRTWLAARPDCTGTVGIIGFCMGGGFVLLHASADRYAAASVNYGRIPGDAMERLAGACPMVGSFGARDLTLRGATARLEQILSEAGVEHDLREYPGASHAFMNTYNPNELSPVFVMFARLAGMAHDAPATQDARRRILAFFDSHLRATEGTGAHHAGSEKPGAGAAAPQARQPA